MVLRIVLIMIFGYMTIINLTRPVITLFATELGASVFEIGILTAAFAFLPLILPIHAGKIADRIGDRLPVLLGFIGLTIAMAIPYFYHTMWDLYLSQIIVGIANIFIVVSLQNVLGNATTPENRDNYFSWFGMATALGVLVGPIIGGYISEHFSYADAFLVSVFISFFTMLFAFKIPVIIKENNTVKAGLLSSVGLLKMPVLRNALFSSALVLYSRDIFVAYFPLYAKQYDISDSTIGWIIAVQGLAMLLIRFALPQITSLLGRDKVLSISIIVAGIAFFLMPFTGNTLLLGFYSCLMGFGLGCGQPLSMATTYSASPKSRTGEVLGLRVSTNRLSQLIAPLFFGLIGIWMGVLSVFLISGIFLLGGTYFLGLKNLNEKQS